MGYLKRNIDSIDMEEDAEFFLRVSAQPPNRDNLPTEINLEEAENLFNTSSMAFALIETFIFIGILIRGLYTYYKFSMIRLNLL